MLLAGCLPLLFDPEKWRQYVPPKLHGVTSQTIVRTSDPTQRVGENGVLRGGEVIGGWTQVKLVCFP
jgi:hypothetical protein